MNKPVADGSKSLPQISGSLTATHAGEAMTAGASERPRPRSLYIHTPFCVHKCHYCDFYSFVDTRDQQAAFTERLIDELRVLAPLAGPLQTIFVGGGTPSLLRTEHWQRLLRAINDLFDLHAIRQAWHPEHSDPWRGVACGEFTVECNPESTTDELMQVLVSGGVNRVSIGAQSFDSRHLKTLERWHNPENVQRAVKAARRAGVARQSIDLIFGVPGQTLAEWAHDLDIAVGFGTTHLSCYALTYEPNTAMTKRLQLGQFEPIAEELEAEMFRHTFDRLGRAGLDRYEVSNFAKKGHESRHNLAYWIQEQWLAAGPSASGHVLAGATKRSGSHRFKNVPRLGDYLGSRGFSPVVDVEQAEPLRLVRERVMMGLRLDAGLEIQPVLADLAAIAPDRAARLQTVAERMVSQGWMDMGERWRLTPAGFLLCDGIAAQLMGALERR